MELIGILKYMQEDPWDAQGPAWLAMWLWMIVAISWFIDLYPLLKKKSQRETMAVVALPGLVVLCVAVLSTLLLGITTGPRLNDGQAFMEWRPSVELLITAVAFLLIWFLSLKMHGQKNTTWRKRLFWAVSYIPDFIVAVCMLVVSLGRLAGGKYFLAEMEPFSAALGFREYNIFAWIFAYSVMMLLIKFGLLLVALLARLITARIPVGRYREDGHPARRFIWYALFCQNAYFRGMVAMFLPLAAFFTVLFFGEFNRKWDMMLVTIIFMIYSCTATYIMFTLWPLVRTLRGFGVWGDRNAKLEQFCREYFNEPPVLRTENYTMTRHFLVDERSVVEVYCLEMLESWKCCFEGDALPMKSGTVQSPFGRAMQFAQGENPPVKASTMGKPYTVGKAERSGWEWRIAFLDGKICCMEKEDKDAEAILKKLRQYMEIHQLKNRSGQELLTLRNSRENGIYEKLWAVCFGALLLSFLMMMQTVR